LNFQKSFNSIVFSYWRYLHGNFDLSSLFLSDFESHFFEILKSLIASNWKYVLIEVIKFCIIAASNYSQHKRIRTIVFNDLILETNGHIKLLYGSRKQGRFAKHNISAINLYEIFCLGQLSRVIVFLLRRHLFWFLSWALSRNSHILNHFLDNLLLLC